MAGERFAKSLEPPYWAVIFTAQRTPGDDGYGETAALMEALAPTMPGYLGHELLRCVETDSRYLLLDHAVRIAGDLQGEPLFELIQAADIIAVPSRSSTPWWPILAANRPPADRCRRRCRGPSRSACRTGACS